MGDEKENKQITTQEKSNAQNTKTKKNKTRKIVVIGFIILFAIVSYVVLRGSYLEYKELGENYISVFFTNLKYKYSIMAISFLVLYIIIYFTNKGIRKGLKEFFDKENKSIAPIYSIVDDEKLDYICIETSLNDELFIRNK